MEVLDRPIQKRFEPKVRNDFIIFSIFPLISIHVESHKDHSRSTHRIMQLFYLWNKDFVFNVGWVSIVIYLKKIVILEKQLQCSLGCC